jgi:FkbM family methyltransferase
MSFADELNACVAAATKVPRPRFESGLSDDAYRWIAKKHAGGAVHEPATIGAMLWGKHILPPRRHIFDIGALYGYFSLVAEQIFSNAVVTAFEMHPGVLPDLVANRGPHTRVVAAALSDVSRENVRVWISGFNIYEEPDGGWDALATIPGAMKERGANNRGRGFADVDFITLDDYCATNPAPDLIKIDVEGYQAKAIAGAMNTIRRHKPVIVIELHDPEKLERFGTTNAETVRPLYEAGYSGFWCGNFRDADARFEAVPEMRDYHEKLSIMVFVP